MILIMTDHPYLRVGRHICFSCVSLVHNCASVSIYCVVLIYVDSVYILRNIS
jgi:hypothetical protein